MKKNMMYTIHKLPCIQVSNIKINMTTTGAKIRIA